MGQALRPPRRDLHRYLAFRVDAQVADDLVSEAFLIGWERRDTFDPERASLKAWVFGMGPAATPAC
ncbi:sigma factor [Crossiella sp. SN42]|uniref:RNA polymerase sigma factor n=1 Tax=Crossiella sp. SN42 TaxID=2944808 RepID=UPI0027E0A16E|nr:sigma factor [Crossiella sp. SN42]